MTTKCLLCHVEDVAYSPSKLEPVGDDAPLDLQKTACNRCGVRYHFGGTLLGIPGLINAYKTSTALALQTTPVIQKSIEINYRLQFDYTKMNEVMILVKKYNCSIIKQQMELFCTMEIGVPSSNHELAILKFGEIHGIELIRI